MSAFALTPVELFEQCSPSVFAVHALDRQGRTLASGSGVAIGAEQVITSCRVLAKASGIRVQRGKSVLAAKLEWPDPERDLCQLQVRELEAPPAPLGASVGVKVGQRVFAIGAPHGPELALAEGLVSSLRELEDGKALRLQTSAALSPGGALFDEDGRLVGITGTHFRGEQGSLALPVEWLREVPERARQLLAKRKAASEELSVRMPKAGDSWTYVLVDMTSGDRSRTFVHTVRTVDPGAIEEVVVNRQGEQVSQTRHTSETSAFYRARGNLLEVAPYITAFRLPRPGERWKVGGDTPFDIEQARVVGPERIRVAAGSFDAIRVDLEGKREREAYRRERFRDRSFRQSVWYAPQVKRIVRSLMEVDGRATAYELESYALH
jgi:hypothetical protein